MHTPQPMPAVGFPQLCAIARVIYVSPTPPSTWGDWKYEVLERVLALGFQSPDSDAIWKALDAVQRGLTAQGRWLGLPPQPPRSSRRRETSVDWQEHERQKHLTCSAAPQWLQAVWGRLRSSSRNSGR